MLFVFFGYIVRLDVYIYDYLVKKKLHTTAKAFMTEGKVAPDPVGNINSKKLPSLVKVAMLYILNERGLRMVTNRFLAIPHNLN